MARDILTDRLLNQLLQDRSDLLAMLRKCRAARVARRSAPIREIDDLLARLEPGVNVVRIIHRQA